MRCILLIFFLILSSVISFAQTEVLTNSTIIELTKAGLAPDLIVAKMHSSSPKFDVSATALIELKRSGVDDGVIAWMIQSATKSATTTPEGAKTNVEEPALRLTPYDALANAKTIAIKKSSLNPS